MPLSVTICYVKLIQTQMKCFGFNKRHVGGPLGQTGQGAGVASCLSFSFFFNFLKFIYLLVAFGFGCCVWAFSSCCERGLFFLVVRGFLIVVASLVVEHGLQACRLQQLWHVGSVVVAHGLQSACSVVVVHGLQQLWRTGFSSYGSQAQLLCGMWDLPRPGIKPMSLHWQADF